MQAEFVCFCNFLPFFCESGIVVSLFYAICRKKSGKYRHFSGLSGLFQIKIPWQWSISRWMIWAVQPVKVLKRV